MQWIVTQKPRRKYRGHYKSVVAIIEAKSAADAKRQARALGDDAFSVHQDFNVPEVALLNVGTAYFI